MKKKMFDRQAALLFLILLTVSLPWPLWAQQKASPPAPKPATAAPQQKESQPAAAALTALGKATPITGSGTANTIPVFTGASTIGNSLVTQTGNGINVSGTVGAVSFTGNGSALTNVNASTLGGQSSSSFAQTGAANTFNGDQTINGTLVLKSPGPQGTGLTLTGSINDTLTLQGNLTDANGQEGANFIGGFGGDSNFPGNSIAPGVIGATIGGGGGAYDPSLLIIPKAGGRSLRGGRSRNSARSATGAPNTGLTSGNNVVQSDWGTVSGGLQNSATGLGSVIGGGYENVASGYISTISGGEAELASGDLTFIGGGDHNTASSDFATVSGGQNNNASGYNSTIGGGGANNATLESDTVAGGSGNTASGSASGYATVPGGLANTAAGDFSFAAGCSASASYTGSFVWAGASEQLQFNCVPVGDTASGQFVAGAPGGVYFYTSTSGASGSGATLPAGSGSWTSLSDRNSKDNFLGVDATSLLEKLAALRISTWNYKTQATSIRHMGPTAQDFRAAFGLGEDETHISNIDSEGVALAGVQALYAELKRSLEDKDREIADLRARLAHLERSVSGR